MEFVIFATKRAEPQKLGFSTGSVQFLEILFETNVGLFVWQFSTSTSPKG